MKWSLKFTLFIALRGQTEIIKYIHQQLEKKGKVDNSHSESTVS